MQSNGNRWIILALTALILTGFVGSIESRVSAAEPPSVAKHIPQDAAYAFFLSNPGESLSNLDNLLTPFKILSPEIDLAKQGEKLKEEIGVNPLTKDGLESMGVDTTGTFAFYAPLGKQSEILVVALSDPQRFKSELFRMAKDKSAKLEEKPKRVAGAEIYRLDSGFIGFKGKWCVMQPEAARKGPKNGPMLSFFKKGRKLASSKEFSRAWSHLPDGQHAVYFVSMKQLSTKLDQEMAALMKEMAKTMSGKAKQSMNKNLQQERKNLRAIFKILGFVESCTIGWRIESKSVTQSFFLATKPKGLKLLKKMVQARTSAPGFHAGLAESAIAGGWLAVDILPILKHFGPVPLYPGFTFKKALDREADEFKKETQIDLFGEIFSNLKGPWASYLLTPGQADLASEQDPDKQLLKLLRIAFVAKSAQPAKMKATIKKFNAFAARDGKTLKTQDVDGASIHVFQPEPGAELAWGLKGDSVFFTFGQNTAQALVKVLPNQPWGGVAPKGQAGSAQLNIDVLAEGMASAVSKGVGGKEGAQFRMVIWPMVQQVLSKIGKIDFSLNLVPGGLLAAGSINLH